MTALGVDDIAKRLASLEAAVERTNRYLDKLGGALPSTLSMGAAARELSVSPNTLRGMIRDGVVQTVRVGKRRHVSAKEIARVASLVEASPVQHGHRPKTKTSIIPKSFRGWR